MNNPFPFERASLVALAPVELPNVRTSRYLGDTFSVTVDAFGTRDEQRVRCVYTTLQELLAIVRGRLDQGQGELGVLQQFAQQVGWLDLVRDVQRLGEDSDLDSSSDTLNKVIHDVRGGGFQALSIQLQFIDLGLSQSGDLHRLFFLTRDHLKIMRNAVADIDPEGYERDRRENLHNVFLLTEKWQNAVHKLPNQSAVVLVDCQFAGNVSERCLEFAALDRVLYNLMNNAVRNTADGKVYLSILPFPEHEAANLRFVIYNAVTPEQHHILRKRHGDSLSDLFRGGFTTGGTGLGMRICADFVTNAYGVRTVSDGIAGGYIGAKLAGDYFVNWFHWPIAGD